MASGMRGSWACGRPKGGDLGTAHCLGHSEQLLVALSILRAAGDDRTMQPGCELPQCHPEPSIAPFGCEKCYIRRANKIYVRKPEAARSPYCLREWFHPPMGGRTMVRAIWEHSRLPFGTRQLLQNARASASSVTGAS